MITRLRIQNFKSLVDFELPRGSEPLPRFTCLIGMNGAGKSTLLQAFDFLGQMVIGKIEEWLAQREWQKNELVSNFGKRTPIVSFEVHFDFGAGPLVWRGRFNTVHLNCTFERLEKDRRTLLELSEGRLTIAQDGTVSPQITDKLNLLFEGSILSVLQLTGADPDIIRVKEALRGLKSLELLSPHLLRRKARNADDIGIGGEKLSPFLAQLSSADKLRLTEQLAKFYPHVQGWGVKGYRAGWKGLRVWEDYATRTPVDAAHLNDGMLRVIAILAQACTDHSFLLFDEIENGMNPELVEKLVDFLINCGKQVVVTTHSPMILNYIPDEEAKAGVILLYKNSRGETQSVRFFDLPAMQQKLRALGPGEVFADTRLTELVAELEHATNNQNGNSTQP